MENLELCRKCEGKCCKINTGNYDCIPCSEEEFEERLGIDFVICCDLLINPSLFEIDDISKMVPTSDTEVKMLKDFKVFKYLVSKGFITDKTCVKIFYSVKPKGEKDYKVTQIYDMDNVCTFLTDKGCKLNYDDRPYECRELVPRYVNGKFSCGDDKSDTYYHIIDNMIEYQEYLNSIAYKIAQQIVKDVNDGKSFNNKIVVKDLLELAETIIENNENSEFEF